jgi:hypothetical protein
MFYSSSYVETFATYYRKVIETSAKYASNVYVLAFSRSIFIVLMVMYICALVDSIDDNNVNDIIMNLVSAVASADIIWLSTIIDNSVMSAQDYKKFTADLITSVNTTNQKLLDKLDEIHKCLGKLDDLGKLDEIKVSLGQLDKLNGIEASLGQLDKLNDLSKLDDIKVSFGKLESS